MLIAALVGLEIHNFIDEDLLRVIMVTFIADVIMIFGVYVFVLSKDERKIFLTKND